MDGLQRALQPEGLRVRSGFPSSRARIACSWCATISGLRPAKWCRGAMSPVCRRCYCMLGNQPHVKLNTRKSTATELVFDFAGGTNLNPRRDQHMHSLTLTLPSGAKGAVQKLSFTGISWKGGKPNPSCASTMTRVR